MSGRHFLQRLLDGTDPYREPWRHIPRVGEVSREILRELGCLLDASEEDFAAGTPSTTDVVP